jgi:mono/diheme cytochrome c family protein
MTKYFPALLLTVALYSCHPGSSSKQKNLNTDALISNFFTVDANRDTLLLSPNGARIEIAKGSFKTNDKQVRLEIKEAYCMESMLIAGLTTQSNGQQLSSAGMIYINVAGENNVTITKPVKVSLPTDILNPEMQVFRGEKKDNDINWVDPAPLPDSIQQILQTGNIIFQQNCATCHALDRDLTGPALAHIGRLRPKQWLLDVTHNPAALMQKDCYLQMLKEQYGVIMQAFPNLDAKQICAIYTYLNSESDRLKIAMPKDELWKCADTCEQLSAAYALLRQQQEKRTQFIKDNDSSVRIDYDGRPLNTQFQNDTSSATPQTPSPALVQPEQTKSEYYQFNIQAFGWYNIDIFSKEIDSFKESTLAVRLTGQYVVNLNVFLAIPDFKVFVQGGKLEGEDKGFGFYTPDGKLKLPIGTKAYVFVMGEKQDQLLFDYKEFIIADNNLLEISAKATTKTQMNAVFKSMDVGGLNIEAQDAENATDIRALDVRIKKVKKQLDILKPVNCKCNCGDFEVINNLERSIYAADTTTQ